MHIYVETPGAGIDQHRGSGRDDPQGLPELQRPFVRGATYTLHVYVCVYILLYIYIYI